MQWAFTHQSSLSLLQQQSRTEKITNNSYIVWNSLGGKKGQKIFKNALTWILAFPELGEGGMRETKSTSFPFHSLNPPVVPLWYRSSSFSPNADPISHSKSPTQRGPATGSHAAAQNPHVQPCNITAAVQSVGCLAGLGHFWSAEQLRMPR